MLISNIISEENIFDFTIIGTGPASITLALELERKGFSSILFEAGGTDYSEESQNYYSGDVVGDKYFPLDVTRLRYFGGSSNHWGGWCRPLDEHDLVDWPINYYDLKKFLIKASNILEIDGNFQSKYIDENFNQINFQLRPNGALRFKEKYYEKIIKSKKIGLCLNSPLLKIIGDDNGNADKIEIFNNNNKKTFKTKTLILGCGGIENSRILLWSQVNSNTKFLKNIKIGNFWMEHPHYTVGHFVGIPKIFFHHFDEKLSADLEIYLCPSYNFMNKHQIRNAGIRLQYQLDSDYIDRLIKDLYCVAPKYVKNLLSEIKKISCVYKIDMAWEQAPEYENKIELSKNKKDDLGIPKVSLFWKKNKQVKRTAKICLTELGKILATKNIGRIGILDYINDNNADYPENDPQNAGHHHMGGTRIGYDPNNYDVVDSNLKVFNTNNLYIIGSSVFRTGGHANPTLTIVQLSLRLAEHLLSLKKVN